MNVEFSFESLPMRRRELVSIGNNQYRVTGAGGEAKQIEANTAYEAFKLSGLTNAIKIERLVNIRPIIIKKSAFVENKPAAEASDNLADIMKAEAEQLEQNKKLMKAVISADDLDKIMQSSKMADEPSVTVVSQNASGTDLHGDGFDEMIPNAPPPAAPKAPAAPAKEAAQPRIEIPAAPAEQLPPEKTLSPDEVEKLLSGDTPK